MPARFSGRTNNRNSSGSGMEKNPAGFRLQPLLGPLGMLGSQTRNFQLARRPIELLGQVQPLCPGYPTKDFELLWAGLFIRQHEKRVPRSEERRGGRGWG